MRRNLPKPGSASSVGHEKLRIAVVSTGLGRVYRGFESFTRSLYDALRDHVPDLEVTLFQGGPSRGGDSVVLPNLHRADVPAKWFSDRTASLLEKRSFALALYPILRTQGYDLVHYNELSMGSVLYHLRRAFGGRFRLLYCNGAPSPPIHYRERCDFVQVLTGPDEALARSEGVGDERIFAVPYGIDEGRFHPKARQARDRVRAELGVPRDAQMVLSVAAIKTEHKRINYLIEEVAKLKDDTWLVVAGQRTHETTALEGLAESRISGRWRFVSWPHERVPELCGAADLFALCSLTEAFGLVTIEAMLCETPVIVHNGPVYRWLTEGSQARTVDMSAAGALSETLRAMLNSLAVADHRREKMLEQAAADRQLAAKRFGWSSLAPVYAQMYTAVVNRSR